MSEQSGRAGRRPGSPDTRGQILAAAGAEFAERGYDGASVRAIAARAGVNPALISHYFGGKESLFAAVVRLPFTPDDVFDRVAGAPAGLRGERLTRTFLDVWEDPARRAPVLALVRSALSHESAALLIRQFAQRVMVPRVAHVIGGADAELRAEAAVSHLLGLAVARHVLRIEPLASTDPEELVALVAPAVQLYFDRGPGTGSDGHV